MIPNTIARITLATGSIPDLSISSPDQPNTAKNATSPCSVNRCSPLAPKCVRIVRPRRAAHIGHAAVRVRSGGNIYIGYAVRRDAANVNIQILRHIHMPGYVKIRTARDTGMNLPAGSKCSRPGHPHLRLRRCRALRR